MRLRLTVRIRWQEGSRTIERMPAATQAEPDRGTALAGVQGFRANSVLNASRVTRCLRRVQACCRRSARTHDEARSYLPSIERMPGAAGRRVGEASASAPRPDYACWRKFLVRRPSRMLPRCREPVPCRQLAQWITARQAACCSAAAVPTILATPRWIARSPGARSLQASAFRHLRAARSGSGFSGPTFRQGQLAEQGGGGGGGGDLWG